ncbi:MAG: hypothetical protein EHM57_03675 [Actinobacteria bacterium]|nr:MAG: hypothetical protein EHM57_03675 [Actinomycetota bacterium]
MRRRRISAETAQTLVGVTVTSMVLLTGVTAVTGPAAEVWATAGITGLVAGLAVSVMGAVRARDTAEERLRADREAATDLARHVEAAAAAMRGELAALRSMTCGISILEEETAAMSASIDRAESTLADMEIVVSAAAGRPLPHEVVDVWRTVRRAVHPIDVVASGEDHPFALTSRRAFETALRLITSTMSKSVAVSVLTMDGESRVTLSSEDGGLEQAEVDTVFGPTPAPPLHVAAPLGRIALARFVMRHTGGDLAYIRALGRSNYVLTMRAVETPATTEETPPILTLTLPLEPAEDSHTSGSGEPFLYG